eukprot:m51a1_g14601 putative 26s proteasome non-atpase regulatory subunit 4 (420) ;mRNA; r:1187160-1188860
MPEAIVIIVDASEWMRNGDYVPNRMQAQVEAINILAESRMSSNPESSCGVVEMGARPRVLLTLTPAEDVGKVLTAVHDLQLSPASDLLAALRVAKLVLKHRENKVASQRIIAFVGSPLKDGADAELREEGARLRADGVALDVVSFGENEHNYAALDALLGGDQSRLVNAVADAHMLLSDMVFSRLVIEGGAGAAQPGAGGAGAAAPAQGGPGAAMGFNEELDPELATALRDSLAEEQARQARLAQEQQPAGGSAAAPAAAQGAADDEEEQIRLALMLSQQEHHEQQQHQQQQQAPQQQQRPAEVPAVPMDISEDEMIRMALEMSMAEAAHAAAPAAQAAPAAAAPAQQRPAQEEKSVEDVLSSEAFLRDVAAGLPGVDLDSPEVREAMAQLAKQQQQQQQNQQQPGGSDKPDAEMKPPQ